jgi:hypothetical protein
VTYSPKEDLFVSRNNALHFAMLTRENLFALERAKEAGETVHSVTQLVNSLFGMVVFAWEKNFVEHIKKVRLSELQDCGWPSFNLMKGQVSMLGDFIWHLRNSFAHGRMSFSSDSPNLEDVLITIEDKGARDVEPTWIVCMTAADLRSFCLKLGELIESRIG